MVSWAKVSTYCGSWFKSFPWVVPLVKKFTLLTCKWWKLSLPFSTLWWFTMNNGWRVLSARQHLWQIETINSAAAILWLGRIDILSSGGKLFYYQYALHPRPHKKNRFSDVSSSLRRCWCSCRLWLHCVFYRIKNKVQVLFLSVMESIWTFQRADHCVIKMFRMFTSWRLSWWIGSVSDVSIWFVLGYFGSHSPKKP